jgi:hypothetical protein
VVELKASREVGPPPEAGRVVAVALAAVRERATAGVTRWPKWIGSQQRSSRGVE